MNGHGASVVLTPRAWDLTGPGRAALFMAPEGLADRVAELPLPCRVLSVPLSLGGRPPGGAALPPGVVALRGRRSTLYCGPAAAVRALAGVPAAALEALRHYDAPAATVRFADGASWNLCCGPRVMGILNVTPDSFSDGGRFLDPGSAAEQAGRLLREGADILDLGAESTRPGAEPVPPEDEWARLAPVLVRVRAEHPAARLSVDTRRAAVAQRALDAGADMINDVAALAEPGMAEVIAAAGVPVVLMHMRGTPGTMQSATDYADLAGEVAGALARSAVRARDAGVAGDRILVDPGLGFGKSAQGNVELISQLGSLFSLGYPLLVGASRKRFIGLLTGVEPAAARVAGSVAAAVACVLEGAAIVRVHDVAPTREALDVVTALRAGVTALRAGVTALRAGVTALDGGVTALDAGVTALGTGVTALGTGADALGSGAQGLRTVAEGRGNGRDVER